MNRTIVNTVLANCVVTLMLVLITPIVNAQWLQTNGPSSLAPDQVLVHHNKLFATYRNFYRTDDEGAHWVKLPVPNNYSKLAIDMDGPLLWSNGDVLLATASYDGLYRSTNDGEQWTEPNPMFRNNQIADLKGSENYLFASAYAYPDTSNQDYVPPTLYWSKDTGLTWKRIILDSLTEVSCVFKFKGMLFVSGFDYYAQNGALYVSSDAGVSWQRRDSAIHSTMYGSWVHKLFGCFDILYAATEDGVFWSMDTGRTWNQGVMRKDSIADYPWTSTSIVAEGNVLVVGTMINGVFRSLDSGRTWVRSDLGGYPREFVSDLTMLDSDIIVGTQKGIYRSRDTGQTWVDISGNSKISTVLSLIKVDSVLFANADGGSIYRSSNGGESWLVSYAGTSSNGIISSQFASIGSTVFSAIGTNLYRSNDLGEHWTTLDSNGCMTSIVAHGTTLYATNGCGTLRQSTDYGNTWSKLYTTAVNQGNDMPIALVDSVMIVGDFAAGGILRSSDRGATWNPITICVANANSYRRLFAIHDVFYAMLYPYYSELYRSSDLGLTWSLDSAGLPDMVQDVSMTSWKNTTILSSDQGSFTSSDNGLRWTRFPQDFAMGPYVWSNTVDGNTLYAGTWGYGVWKRDMYSVGVTEPSTLPQSQTLFAYPNPFHSSTTIHYSTESASRNSITICDLLGNTIAQVRNEFEPAGEHDVSIELPVTHSGVLFIRVRFGIHEVVTPIIQSR